MKIIEMPVANWKKRVDALLKYQIMDTPPEAAYDDVVRRASEICGTHLSAVTLLDDRRQWFKAKRGFATIETPIEDAFCARAIEHPHEVMVVPDATRDERFRDNPAVTSAMHLRFYAGAPLVTPDGVPIGTVCVLDKEPRELSDLEGTALKGLASETIALMEASRLRALLDRERVRVEQLEVSEAYFRHLTEYALDLITILEADGTIRFESRSIERELGHAPAHYRGRNAFEFVHPEDCPAVMKAFQEALVRHGNTPVIRFRFRHADGSYRILEGSGNNLLGDPVVGGIVFNSRDITETVKLQEKVERARQEKEDTIARLTGGVAHDVNNMLTAVQGLAELSEFKVPAGSDVAGYLGDIQVAVRRGANLTAQLLAFSRRAVLQPRAIELAEWLHGFRPRLQNILGRRVGLTLESRSNLRIWEDPQQFEKVLAQLATNAREAMPNGGHLTIEAFPTTLGAHECPADGREGLVRYVKLSVADNGIGMSEETMARIFEPFYSTKHHDGQHSGLGLSMCRGIIEQSGGHITVRSMEGCGTVFYLFLPSVEAAEKQLINPPPAHPASAPAPRTGKPTILFVDDEAPLREIGAAALRHAGFEVILAEDGPSALARLAELGEAPIDLLVTDVLMPGMNGVQLAEEIMRQRPDMPVLLCSGYTKDALTKNGTVPDGMTFLPKPYTLGELLGVMRQLLGAALS